MLWNPGCLYCNYKEERPVNRHSFPLTDVTNHVLDQVRYISKLLNNVYWFRSTQTSEVLGCCRVCIGEENLAMISWSEADVVIAVQCKHNVEQWNKCIRGWFGCFVSYCNRIYIFWIKSGSFFLLGAVATFRFCHLILFLTFMSIIFYIFCTSCYKNCILRFSGIFLNGVIDNSWLMIIQTCISEPEGCSLYDSTDLMVQVTQFKQSGWIKSLCYICLIM